MERCRICGQEFNEDELRDEMCKHCHIKYDEWVAVTEIRKKRKEKGNQTI